MSIQFSGGNQIGYHEGIAVLGGEDSVEKTKKSDTKVSEKKHRDRAEDTMSMPSTVKSLSARQSFVTHEGAKAENDELQTRVGQKEAEEEASGKTIDELSLSKSLRQNAIEDILFAGITTIFGTNQRGLRKRKRPVKLRGRQVIKPGMRLPDPVFEETEGAVSENSKEAPIRRFASYKHYILVILLGVFIGALLFSSPTITVLTALILGALLLTKRVLGR